MLKKLNNILNIIMGSFVGVTIGHSIYQYINYRKYPDLYAMQSAPWYTSIQIYGLCTLIVVGICFAIKYIIKMKTSRNK